MEARQRSRGVAPSLQDMNERAYLVFDETTQNKILVRMNSLCRKYVQSQNYSNQQDNYLLGNYQYTYNHTEKKSGRYISRQKRNRHRGVSRENKL